MANIVAPQSLWTPDGEVNLGLRDQQMMNPQEMQVMRNLHPIAQKFNFCIVCMRCNKAVQGMNQGGETTFAVACQCREIRGASRTV